MLPWFKPRRWQTAKLATDKSVAFKGRLKGRPFMGIIAPKEGKHEIILQFLIGQDLIFSHSSRMPRIVGRQIARYSTEFSPSSNLSPLITVSLINPSSLGLTT